jgi:hypothetical protein
VKRLLVALGLSLILVSASTAYAGTNCPCTCVGVITEDASWSPPVIYQLSSLSVNTPTYRVGVHIPWGWPMAPFNNPAMAPSLFYSFQSTYLGPTYFGWINTGYLTGDVHWFGTNALIMLAPSYIGYVSTAYSGDCPIP